MEYNKEPKIIFMGTPDFAVGILETLIIHNFNIVAVVTAPDKPAGRGRKLSEAAVKKFVLKNKIPVLQPNNLKSEEFISQLKAYQADLQIVVAFRMLPKVIWSLPKLGTFNLHASLLPQYRGAAPIHWAIINGETKTGVTTFLIDDKIDTGAIILKEEIDINSNETFGKLHDKLMILGASVVCKTIDLIKKGEFKTTKQSNIQVRLAPKLTSENTKIDWTTDLDSIHNKIRGLNPFPSAWTEIKNGEEIINAKIYEVKKEYLEHPFELGKIIQNKNELKIACKKGFISIQEIKLSGKKKMNIKSLLNGFTFNENAKVL